jgi:3-oxoacyl-[acyl-carrier-protein] synthase II
MDLMAGQAKAILAAAEETGELAYDVPAFARAFRRLTNPLASLRGLPNLAAASVAIQQDARGPNATIATACSSGTQAIGEGLRLLQRGDADVIFAGGADAMINPVGVEGFSMLGTLSCRNDDPGGASRPFDRTRDGFVIGEGAAVLVLEREEHARARGAPIRAVLAGYGVTCDAFRITDERPDADGAARAITLALRDAGVTVEDVQYVNAHGTGTVMNDVIETRALRRVFGASAGGLQVSSTKSMVGHLLAAAGAVEAAATVLSLEAGFIAPTINYSEPDPDCDLDYVPNSARGERFSVAISNSFGFGGQNACLVISRP